MLNGRLDSTHFLIGTRFTDANPKLILNFDWFHWFHWFQRSGGVRVVWGPASSCLGWDDGRYLIHADQCDLKEQVRCSWIRVAGGLCLWESGIGWRPSMRGAKGGQRRDLERRETHISAWNHRIRQMSALETTGTVYRWLF